MSAELGAARYRRVEKTTWPVNTGEVEWDLRYGPARNLVAASVVAAYSYLTGPDLSEADAVAALRLARKAVASV